MTSPLHSFARRGTVIVASLATAALALSVSPASADPLDTGSITGTVSVTTGDLTVTSVRVTAWQYDTADDYWEAAGTEGVVSPVDGSYEITGLAAGDYRVGFEDSDNFYVTEYYDDKLDFEQANLVTVADGVSTEEVDADLVASSHVLGQVTGTGGVALEDIYVSASVNTGTGDYPWREASSAYTDEDGNYDLGGLAGDDYKVSFSDESGTYLEEFFDNEETIEASEDVAVGENDDVLGIDARLAKPSHITGQVTDAATGLAVAGADVSAERVGADGEFYPEHATTDASGNYDIEGLRAASYRLSFSTEEGYFFEYYNNAQDEDDATNVTVPEDQTVSGRNAALEPTSSVSGHLADNSGPVADALVIVFKLATDNGVPYWDYIYDDVSNGNGDYSVQYMEGGTYRVGFFTSYNTHVVEYYDNAADLESAADVVVPRGGSLTLNADLAVTPAATPPVVTPPVVVPPVVTPPLTDVDSSHKPKVKGATKVGSTLKAKVASWIPAGATVKYTWLVNGKPIKKATKAKLKLTKKLKGKKVSVKVTATSAGSLPVTVVTKVGRIKG